MESAKVETDGAVRWLTKAREFPGPRLVESIKPGVATGDDWADSKSVPGGRGGASERARAGGPAVENAVKDMDRVIDRVARSRVSVLITGETGVGKDVLAHRIHGASPRAGGPFVAINCAAFSDTLLDSEFFGHERGAFTGADRAKVGLFESADGGTLFLDEVGELSTAAQAKLLRVLETRCVQRVGGLKVRAVDVRLISATNRDLGHDTALGRFRADLLFRLEGLRLNLPPLRERPWEILPAVRHFLDEHARREGVLGPTLTGAAERALCEHPWMGNFRELRNVIERAALLCEDGRIDPDDLALASPTPPSPVPCPDGGSNREHIVAVLNACGGNQTRAAQMLGMSRRTLITRLDTYGLPRPRRRAGEPASDSADPGVGSVVPNQPNKLPPLLRAG